MPEKDAGKRYRKIIDKAKASEYHKYSSIMETEI